MGFDLLVGQKIQSIIILNRAKPGIIPENNEN